MELKSKTEWTIWSVAPVSMIQSILSKANLFTTSVVKIVEFRTVMDEEQKALPEKLLR